jgi:hypothetical protein
MAVQIKPGKSNEKVSYSVQVEKKGQDLKVVLTDGSELDIQEVQSITFS